MAVMDTFAKRLKSLREEHKLSQTELANALGISRGSLSFYENVERTADIEILYKTSEYFGVTLDYLIGNSNNRTKDSALIGDITGLSDRSIMFLDEVKDDFWLIKSINTFLENENLVVALARYFFTVPVGGSFAVYGDGSFRIESKDEASKSQCISVVSASEIVTQALIENIKSEINFAKDRLREEPKWWVGGLL